MASRQELIELCERGVVSVDKWSNMSSHCAQQQLAHCWMLLRAGCDFHIYGQEEHRIYVRISHPTFETMFDDLPYKKSDFYLPTSKLLNSKIGEDWY